MFRVLKRVLGLVFLIFCLYEAVTIHKNVHRVLQYKPIVEHILAENGNKADIDLVLAMIYTETKGGEADVMQSSESSSGIKNSITDSQASIEHGVRLLSHNLTLAEKAGVDSWTAIQAYNFGTAYIDYIAKNGGQHTVELATTYSRTVVAPSLGNTTGQTYFYYHPLALLSGGKLYCNGGNIYYAQEVHVNLYLIELMSLF
ncbi:lysozyme family protein [Streptococcus equi]|uniref:lysozyme family protein n=1 Tax=Streptococcus equi TaxID=1336 RepID=UPI0024A9579F|nr:lysozyme family protein [Streptococcus equi]MDI6044300.1 lysozyme family protein [Streptococcus equi subsp. zooepidemicus]WKF65656.1 lysozyme family protein [Streptococcus equi subsp. zooepidemicus]HEL0024185.1 lysozyme family protein [Streptococcus equi subsp. zooepidemicus]HEL1117883.1 lysozyme family protein [Streptococcus equi subsp. zooepidemicus]HEL1171195.1 lysozyme family protein [Streptococcus equi subsp. zooepidemicus]